MPTPGWPPSVAHAAIRRGRSVYASSASGKAPPRGISDRAACGSLALLPLQQHLQPAVAVTWLLSGQPHQPFLQPFIQSHRAVTESSARRSTSARTPGAGWPGTAPQASAHPSSVYELRPFFAITTPGFNISRFRLEVTPPIALESARSHLPARSKLLRLTGVHAANFAIPGRRSCASTHYTPFALVALSPSLYTCFSAAMICASLCLCSLHHVRHSLKSEIILPYVRIWKQVNSTDKTTPKYVSALTLCGYAYSGFFIPHTNGLDHTLTLQRAPPELDFGWRPCDWPRVAGWTAKGPENRAKGLQLMRFSVSNVRSTLA